MPHPESVEQTLSKLTAPFLAQAAPTLQQTWDGKSNVKLWDSVIKVLGKNMPAHKQTIGDCVSHGHGGMLDYLQCIQIALGKFKGEFIEGEEAYTEAIYGNCRQRAGQLSMMDGAAGIWAMDSLIKDGYPRRKGRPYDGQVAKKYGAEGVPAEIKAEGADFKLVQYIQVRTVRDAIDLLSNGYPITVCSNQGFTLTRNSQGVCSPQGAWAHCMFCIGGILLSGLLHFMIVQSWGQNVPTGPTIENMPDNAFLAEESVFQRMLNANDSYAPTSIPGFPAQELDFFI